MIQRCHNPNAQAYKDYGERGIKVCKRWCDSFEDFLDDVGKPQPGAGLTIERVDNNRGYEPGNVGWVTRKAQANNRRNSLLIEHDGQELPLTTWCERLQLPYEAVYRRIAVYKWPPSEALTTPVRSWRPRK
jgi:hypothetical protein